MLQKDGTPTRSQDSLRQLLTWFLSPKSKGLELDGRHAISMIAEQIASGYELLDQAFRAQPDRVVRIEPLLDIEYRERDPQYLAPVIQLGEYARGELREFLSDFLVHGSLATMDYSKGWSDYDTFLIVRSESAANRSALVTLRDRLLDAYDYLTQVDPLQHHGFIVCTEIDLRNYFEDFMPVAVLEKAKSYYGGGVLELHIMESVRRERANLEARAAFFRDTAREGVMKHHPYEDVFLEAGYRNATNGLFQFKYLVGIAAIAPCYYLGSLGRPTYKRDAILSVRNTLEEDSRTYLDSITKVRDEWPIRESFPYAGNAIPEWVQEAVGPDYFDLHAGLLTELEVRVGGSSA